ncbi:MAG TPA: DNRLRE domain-containing protein, partial [Candidatus Methylomirabilis sp.]|nr:DNRLRE domain-containing protein [Candidatus Methylomirabilis sp.]
PPTTIYEAKAHLRIDASPLLASYLCFHLTGVSGTQVTSAQLQVYALSSNPSGYQVRAVSDTTWGEMTLTYANAPVMGPVISTSSAVQTGKWVSVEVTSQVRSDGALCLAIDSTSRSATAFASRETGATAPRLVVAINSAATVPASLTPTASLTFATVATNPREATATRTQVAPPARSPTPSTTPTQPAQAQSGLVSGSDPIIFFNGDLVSSRSLTRAQSVVALIKRLMAQHPGIPMLVASTGDNEQESRPTLANYQHYFGTTYGTFVTQHIFMQVRGNHDAQSTGSGAAYAQYFGANSHLVNGKTNYAFDLGSWHLIALDQVSSSVSSAALAFLKSDLAAHA